MADVKPILFSGPMVRAILREIEAPGAGKTQTRRVIKLPRKTASGGPIYERKDMGGWEPTTNGGAGCFIVARDGTRRPAPETVGLWHRTTGVCLNTDKQAGDLLWVRETWAKVGDADDDIHACPDLRVHAYYHADSVCPDHQRWRPSIHMPRWASRLTLEVTGVKVERLQDISEADALAEGVVWSDEWSAFVVPGIEHPNEDFPVLSRPTARAMYAALWDFINGLGAWSENTWVAAVTFRPHLCNIDAFPKEKAA